MDVYKVLGNGFLVNFGHYPLIEIIRLANTKGK